MVWSVCVDMVWLKRIARFGNGESMMSAAERLAIVAAGVLAGAGIN